MATGGIQLVDVFKYSGKRFLDLRQHAATLAELAATPETSIPDGFNKFCDEAQCWYEYKSHNDIDAETGRWRKSVPIHEVISDEYIFAIVDADGTFLFGIENTGHAVVPKGIVEYMSREEYRGINPHQNTLYIIKGRNGGTEGAYINGQVLNTGEQYSFFRDANMIKYDGSMKTQPIIHIDHETMEAKIDYPSDYEGPMIVSDPETKTLFVI